MPKRLKSFYLCSKSYQHRLRKKKLRPESLNLNYSESDSTSDSIDSSEQEESTDSSDPDNSVLHACNSEYSSESVSFHNIL